MSYVHAGVLAGDSEVVIDGYVYQNDPNGILASWNGYDSESGISAYVVGIGTAPGMLYYGMVSIIKYVELLFIEMNNHIHYSIIIRSFKGIDDVRPFMETDKTDDYLDGLELELTNIDSTNPAPLYYITVKAKNGAQQFSPALVSKYVLWVKPVYLINTAQ